LPTLFASWTSYFILDFAHFIFLFLFFAQASQKK
jgi:hypothetical protein